jgi:flagellar biosynthesis chaperone FliJ
MTVNRKSRGPSPLNEHKMIDIQYVIQKLEADLEFHKQKIRLIKEELDEENRKLTSLMEGEKTFRKMRDQFRNGFKGERNEK